jgi:hypothetical protein
MLLPNAGLGHRIELTLTCRTAGIRLHVLDVPATLTCDAEWRRAVPENHPRWPDVPDLVAELSAHEKDWAPDQLENSRRLGGPKAEARAR